MAGYAATGRIVQAHPRFVGSRGAWARMTMTGGATDEPPDERPMDAVPLDQRIVDWWAGARKEWAQTTFFLFDPNSWR